MPCNCSELAELEKVEAHANYFKSLPVLEFGNWVKLCKCPVCDQLWSIDEWDKGHISFARKKYSQDNWQYIDVEDQKTHLQKSRGWQVGVKCMQAGCKAPALNGVAFCVNHLYEMGWRE